MSADEAVVILSERRNWYDRELQVQIAHGVGTEEYLPRTYRARRDALDLAIAALAPPESAS